MVKKCSVRLLSKMLTLKHFAENDVKADIKMFVLEFYGPVNNEVMSRWSVNSGTVPGQALTF